MKQPIKMTPGDDLHLTMLMAPHSLNLAVGQFREQLLGYGRVAFEAGMKTAADLVQEQADLYIAEHAETDPDTGSVIWHHRDFGFDWHNQLEELAQKLQARAALETTPAAAQPAQTIERQRMTAGRASFFMERFLKEEKLLGPNEQAALHFVIDRLEEAAAPVVLPEPAVTASVKQTSATSWNVEFNWPEAAFKEAGEYMLFTEQQFHAALLAGVSAPAAVAMDARELQIVMQEASSLAQSIFKKHYSSDEHYASGRVVWGLCDDLRGVISQIDNMSTGLVRAPQAQADARDAELLGFLHDQCLDLRCFTTSDGEDVGWRTVQHHMGEPRERVASEVYSDNPRRAIREAMARIERDPYCTGPLHLEDDAAIAAAKGE